MYSSAPRHQAHRRRGFVTPRLLLGHRRSVKSVGPRWRLAIGRHSAVSVPVAHEAAPEQCFMLRAPPGIDPTPMGLGKLPSQRMRWRTRKSRRVVRRARWMSRGPTGFRRCGPGQFDRPQTRRHQSAVESGGTCQLPRAWPVSGPRAAGRGIAQEEAEQAFGPLAPALVAPPMRRGRSVRVSRSTRHVAALPLGRDVSLHIV